MRCLWLASDALCHGGDEHEQRCDLCVALWQYEEDCGGYRRWAASIWRVQLFAAEEPRKFPQGTDLIVIGGPTEMHRITEPLAEVLHRIEPETLHGVAAATFDTRLRWPRWLAGSAGVWRLERASERGRADDRASGELLC